MARLFLCGDVMLGRGLDQVLPHPCEPTLHETFMKDARSYVALAEDVSGRIPRGVGFEYPWGEALDVLARAAPDARVIVLETSVTRSPVWEDKGINYRLSPENAPALKAAGVDVASLANNHVLDWGVRGLLETLATLDHLGLRRAGAGADLEAAAAPAIVERAGGRRVLVFAAATGSSGVPPAWAADDEHPGVLRLPDLSAGTIDAVARRVRAHRRAGDLVVFSVHWGGNWGYPVPPEHRRFARALVDHAGVDVVHGHSSHHRLGIEVHAGRLILYGCGDLLNDYEGIGGHERYRPELVAMYFPTLDDETGALAALRVVPMRIRRFRLERASVDDARWLADELTREGRELGTSAWVVGDGRELEVTWGS